MAHFTRDNRMQKSPQHDVINIDAQGIKIVFFSVQSQTHK